MMKTFKYILSTFLLIAVIWSCTEDELNNLDFTNSAVAPTNVDALFTITQDNSGFVSISPSADGAIKFDIDYGDGSGSPADVKVGEKANHTYTEGNYSVNITAKGITGLTTSVTKDLLVSFQAPMFGTDPIIVNDPAVSQQVNVTVPDDAQFAMFFEVYFVEDGIETILTGNVGSTVSYIYANPGLVDIKVVLKGGAIATTEFVVTDFEVVKILQPIKSAPTPPVRAAADVISIFSAGYENLSGVDFNPDWGQSGQGSGYAEFDLNGDKMLQYTVLSYQGIGLNQNIDVSRMEFLHLDVWTADAPGVETSLISASNGEKPIWSTLTADQWTSIDIPISDFTDQGLTVADIYQLKFVSDTWIAGTGASGTIFIDNLYFYKAPSAPSKLEGSWKLAPEAGALAVGPELGNYSWWANDAQVVIDRACLFDDEYVFGSNGMFSNVLGADTWIENWQGIEGCGAAVAPHDGSSPASFYYDEETGKLTVTGKGAYLGLPKPYNGGELTNPADAPDSITYDVTLSDNDNTMNLVLAYGSGYWSFKLVRDAPTAPSPLEGAWKVAPEAGALAVGPALGDYSWWANDDQAVIDRACFFDDTYLFSNGSFSNILGSDTWIEGWQGVEGCGAPVAPHDGTVAATYSYDANAGTLTVIGKGAYLGVPKPFNGGELTNPADAPDSITYDVTFSDNGNTMNLVLAYGSGYWSFKLVRETPIAPPPLEGSWKVAPEAGALAVGPALGDYSWWANDDQAVVDRACFFDDEYVFDANGAFSNVLGADTWIEGWQGVEGCGAPVAPHDGTVAATYSYDANAGTITITGKGAYLGVPKPFNGGELTNPADAPDSITYDVELSDNGNTMNLVLAYGAGYWSFKLVKQ